MFIGQGRTRGGPLSREQSSIDELAASLRGAWGADTAWIDDWDPRNPSRGQCGSSALVVHDFRGGTLMRGLVDDHPVRLTVHYWNALDRRKLDLTWQQFSPQARIVFGEPVDRADLLTTAWLTGRYEALRARVTVK